MGARLKPSRCRGVVTLELILTLPVTVIVFFAAFQFAMKTIFQSTVVHAAGVAAREAGKGADLGSVVLAAADVVDVNCIQLRDDPGSGTKVVLEDGDTGTSVFGDPNLACQTPSGAVDPGQVRVTVCVDILATPFCHALQDWGLSFLGATLEASSLVKKEWAQDQP